MASKVLETTVKLAGAIDPSLAKALQNAEKSVGKLNLKGIAIGAAFVAGTSLAIKALYNLGAEFDSAYDAIRVGTGATGDDLEALKDTMKDVYTSVPASMEDTAKAIADYNTRLGLTGDQLGDLSTQALQVSSMLGEDLGTVIESSSQAFQQWGIDSANMGESMDYIFKVSQSTGIGFNELMTSMQQYGPQLQQMGYSFEEASALMGQMEKAGVNTAEVLGAMKKSVGTLAKEGISASDGMKMYYEQIMKAGSAAEATAIANEIFGARAGSTMAEAIRNGTLAVDDLTASLQGNSESINGAYWDTADFAERWQLLQNQMKVGFEPVAMAVFDGLAQLMPVVSRLMETMAPVIADLVTQLTPFINDVFSKLGEVLEMIGPSLAQLVGSLLPPLMSIISALLPPLMNVVDVLLPALADIIAALSPILSVLAELLGVFLTQALNAVLPLVMNIIGVFKNLANFITNVFAGEWGAAWENIVAVFKNVFNGILNWAFLPLNKIISLINTVISGLNMIKLPDWVPGLGGKGINIPLIPTLSLPAFAEGGFTNGVSIAGEAGTEAVISFDPAHRADNISIWEKAGSLLGVNAGGSQNIEIGGLTFNIDISGASSPQDVVSEIKDNIHDIVDELVEELSRRQAGSYGANVYVG
ncbi:MAG: phage tail tape measure protein [Clostridia bacterium]|nr:phage tail tape measure protein [Clostridia bacterium]